MTEPWSKIGKGIDGSYLELPPELVHKWESSKLHLMALCTRNQCKIHTHPDSRSLCPVITSSTGKKES